MTSALIVASLIPLGQSLEGLAGSALYLRNRYDIRAGFLTWSMALRLVGVAIGARYGLVEAIAGVLIAQLISTASVGVVGRMAFDRFPRAAAAPLGEMRREIVTFIAQSSAATGVISLRGGLAPLLLAGVTTTTQTGIFKIAQAPQSGFQALSAPARMVLLTEQTREWERGRQSAVLRQVRRYSLIAALCCLVAVPPLLWLMPNLISWVYGSRWADATNAARLFLLTAAVQLVVGWTKSFPVTIGRPKLRIWTHGLETLVVLPLVIVLGSRWGATGAARRVPRRDGRVRPRVGRDLPPHEARRRAAAGGDRGDGGRGGIRGGVARAMRVLVVSGIWPPDVGGPASHAPDVAAYLRSRGHAVEVVTTAAAAPATEEYQVHWISRSLPKGVIHARTAAEIARRARWADVVYTTGMFGRSASGATLARRPYVVKLTADPAFERARRRDMVGGDVDEFQRAGGDVAIRTLRVARDAELRHAAHVFTPSAYLRELALSWGVPAERVSVLPNPAPPLPELRPRDEIRAELGLNGPTLVFAGRLTAQKSLGVALEAVAANDGVVLLVAGEGDERAPLERRVEELRLGERVRFLGAQPRDRVLELFLAADASILSSSWENFPHTVVEALAVGTPVLATATGGVAEVVRDGENGLLVPSGDAAALAGAVRRFFGDEALRERLRARGGGLRGRVRAGARVRPAGRDARPRRPNRPVTSCY